MILRDMKESDLDAVLAIERAVHAHPWTLGNFSDALHSRYQCKVYETDMQELVGYAVMMLAVDEAELLVDLRLAEGSSMAATEAQVRKLEAILAKAPSSRVIL